MSSKRTQTAGITVVTGAGGAIGSEVVRTLAERQARVLALDIDETALSPLRSEYVDTAVCDVVDHAAMTEVCRKAEAELGPVQGFFNNAGVRGPLKPVLELTEEELAATYQVNVAGVLVGMRVAIELMTESGRGGRILNMSSGSGLRGTAGMGAYVASKHAVLGLTRCAALEVAEEGISVNAVCPGCIETPMMRSVERGLGEDSASITSTIPVRRYAGVSEIAATAVWLLLDAPLFLTGAALPIDGGWAARGT